ncbi:MAG TPA: recombinase family protein, partial [Steroidobacteraceae bacterium]|nr:recombinase family protein [Steroidobacteraceae bacterium]
MRRAYSYVRFSSLEQAKGKSLERQTEAARKYCATNNLELDTALSLHDLGVSAYRGKNADVGALNTFLKAVHAGSVPPHSYLLVEAFDRISREAAYDAQVVVQSIVNAGITIVTLMDGKEYSVKVLRADPMSLVYMILMFTRGHEESSTKSKRVADAWQRKRADLKTGKAFTSLTPGWIELDHNRKPRLISARVKIVRRIFSAFVDGDSFVMIATKLNHDDIPTFKGARWWGHSYIRLLLANRAVLGEFQPHRMEHTEKRKVRVPAGEPIKGYWPAIIDVKTFNAAQKRLSGIRIKPGPKTGLKNILAGLARC